MFNIIRMELYRMFKTKSMYVLWMVMLLIVILSTVVVATDTISESDRQTMEEFQQEEGQSENVGISVVLPSKDKEDLSLADFVIANMQSRVIAIFIVIFAVIFTTADTGTGYIKNIIGQIRKREYLVIAKIAALFINVVLTIGIFVAGQTLVKMIFLGGAETGGMSQLASYLGIQVLLHFALALVSMAIAAVIRSNVISMTCAICICINAMVILYGAIDKLVQKFGIEDFETIKYTVVGKISSLTIDTAGKDMALAAVTAFAFICVSGFLTSYVCRKRDI